MECIFKPRSGHASRFVRNAVPDWTVLSGTEVGDEMKYPCLVPKSLCRTEIHLSMDREGTTKYGDPLPAVEYDGKCNYQDSAKRVMTFERKLVQISGTALLPGDICPELPAVYGGSAEIFGMKRRILQGRKARNPDGTVNYTEVLLI